MTDRHERYESDKPTDQFMLPLLSDRVGRLLAAYATDQAGRALDVGCGGQPFRGALAARGYSYTGVDVAQNRTATVDVLAAIDGPLPPALEASAFDFILCTEVLEHVADWDAAFQNFGRLLRPGGRLLVTCPAFFPLHETPHDYWRPTSYALEYYGRRVRFRVVHQESAGTPWDVLGTLLGSVWALPADRRFGSRAAARLVNTGLRFVFRVLCRRALQRRVGLHGGLYLANIAVFEKA